MTRENLEEKAQEMMHIHNLDEIHLTTDGQGFTDKERAMAHSTLHKDKAVYHFHRKAKEVTVKTDTKVVDTERSELAEKYEKMFDKKPAYNMGLEKMRTAIQEKEAEIENSKESIEEQTTDAEETLDEDKSDLEEGTEQ